MGDNEKGGMRNEEGWYIRLPLADLFQLHLVHARLSELASSEQFLMAEDVLPLVDIVERLLPETGIMINLRERFHGKR